MQLTSEKLVKFIGGEMEIQNQVEDYLYRGLIESIEVADDELRVRFTWCAKNDGGPKRPTRTWVSSDNLDYVANMQIFTATDIGHGRIYLDSTTVGEMIVINPRNGSHLDQNLVRGLAV